MTRDPLRVLAAGVAYFCASKAALFFPDAESMLAAVWPAAGVGLAALLLSPPRLWPKLLLAIFLAGNLASLVSGHPPLNSLVFMCANVFESLGCAWLITAWCGERVLFTRTREVLALILAATAVNGVSTLAGAGAATLVGIFPSWSFWATWFVSDGLGILLVTPLLAAWLGPRARAAGALPSRGFESCLFLACWAAISLASLTPQPSSTVYAPQPYMLLALLAWPALRLSFRTLTLALAVLASIAILRSSLGLETLFMGAANPTQQLLLMQGFLGFVSIAAYFLFAAFWERKQVEAALRQSEHRANRVLQTASEGIWILDAEGLTTYVNPIMASMLGYSPGEILGRPGIDFLFEEDRGDYEARRCVLRSGKVCRYERRLRRKDGSEAWCLTSNAPLLDQDGSYQGSLAMLADISAMKSTEAMLKDERMRLAAIIEGTNVGTWEWNVQTGDTVFNEKWAQIVGYTLEELAPVSIKTWVALAHPHDLRVSEESLERHFAGDSPYYDCECRMRHKEGRWVWVHDRGRLVSRTEDQKPLLMFGTHQDITARKATEQALREREASFRHFYESMADIVWVLDLDGRIQLGNDAASRILGYTREEFQAMHLLDLHPENRRPEAWSTFLAMVRGDQTHVPHSLMRKDGSLVPMDTQVWRGRWRDKDCLFGISRDLSVEQETQQRFESMFRNNPAMMGLTVRPGRHFVDANQAFISITGYQREEFLGKTAQELGLFADETLPGEVAAALDGQGRYSNSDVLIRCKDGSLRHGAFSAEVVHGPRADHVVSVMLDITERRQAEQFREDVERILRHDLKTPLTGLITIPRLLRDDDNLTPEQRALVDVMAASGRRMLNQINGSLELYKIESGIYRFQGRDCDPARLVWENIELLCTIIKADLGRFQVQGRASAPGGKLTTDPLLLDVVLMNLLRNGLEASDPDTPVVVDLGKDGQGYTIAISNNRPVPAEIRDRFFEKFVTAGKQGGTGLGTYSAALMVRAMGGRIDMETSDAAGTTVTLRLPLQPPAAA